MDPSKNDLLRMLFVLEGELQAKEIVISILKNEQIRRLLHPCYDRHRWFKSNIPSKSLTFRQTDTIISTNRAKHKLQNQDESSSDKSNNNTNVIHKDAQIQSGNVDPSNPYIALLRDTYCAYNPNSEDGSCRLICNLQYHQLQLMLEQQRRIRTYLRSQISGLQEGYNSCFKELEIERSKNKGWNDVIRKVKTLEEENRLLQADLEDLQQTLEKEKEREKSMVLCLITERKQLIIRLIEESQKNSELITMLQSEKSRILEIKKELEEESKRSLQLESDLEAMTGKLLTLENKNNKLEEENSKLRKELESMKSKRIASLGEGVRSSIVTSNPTDYKSVPTITPQSAIAPNQSKLNTLSSLTSNRASPPVSTSRPVVSSSPSTQQSTTYASVHSVTKVIPNQTAGHNTLSEAANNPLTPPISKVLSAQAKNVAIAFQPVSHTAEVGRIIASPPVVSPASRPANIARNVPVSPGKVMIVSASPQAPVEKKLASSVVSSSNLARPAPPPVPPNKPILPPNALKEREKELQQTAADRAKILSTNKPQSHGPMHLQGVHVQGENGQKSDYKSSSDPTSTLNGIGTACDMVKSSANCKIVSKECEDLDMNCKELADFHQILSSMELQADSVSQLSTDTQ